MSDATRTGLPPEAYEVVEGRPFRPYVSAGERIPEFSLKAGILGVLVGILFGAANAYLGLYVGLTVSASIPAAVVAIAIFRALGRGSVLETNMVQTIGSAGESLAAGVIFTIPALIIWGIQPDILRVFVISALGGTLGVLFMIPLRRYLIAREHGRLPYPEGTACAEVLVAGDVGGRQARTVFAGLGIGAVYEWLMSGMQLWNARPTWNLPRFRGAQVAGDITPSLLGVGFIIGPRIAGLMLAGGMISWLVLIPLFAAIGEHMATPLYPATDLIANMDPHTIWNYYIRYIGAGAVAVGGFITLARALPTIAGSFRIALGKLGRRVGGAAERTDRDLPIWVVLGGSLLIVVLITLLPQIPIGLLGGILIVFFAFLFVTVSSRIVGLIGSSSNPISGMTIATLLITSLIYVSLGWTGEEHMVGALSVGAVVCVAAAIAGDTSQDLKTGFLVGATPSKQQIGEILGVVTSAACIGWVVLFLDRAYGIPSEKLSAPQATLMSLVVKGVLTAQLPWGLVLTGAFLAATIEVLGIHSLPCAVGIYLPLSLTTPIMAGGAIRWAIERGARSGEERRDRREQGVLYSSGLIGGAALLGILIAGLTVYQEGRWAEAAAVGFGWMGGWGDAVALGLFLVLTASLYRKALPQSR